MSNIRQTCFVCGAGTAKKIRRVYSAKYDGQLVTLPSVEIFHCSDCGEEFFMPEQARAVSIAVKNAVRELSGLLAPDKIVAIRQKLNLTQIELEQLLNQGPKVVTRWESGRVIQNQNADTLLRMLDRDPNTLVTLRKIARDRERAHRRRVPELASV
jgi:HTH-type transcriptional regulator/antitoxin MqsA